jgi:Rad3-related DNA helicase
VLPAYRHIIFDEAHNLEAAATSALSIEISTARLHFVTSTLWRPGGRKTGTGPVAVVLNRLKEDHARFLPSHVDRIGAMATAIISGITATHAEVTGLLATLADALAAGGLRESIRIPAERPSVPAWIAVDDKRQQLTATLASLCRHATELRDVLEEVDTAAFDDRNDSIKQLEGAAGELNAYSGDVTLVINAATAGYVFWLERFGNPLRCHLRSWQKP